MEEAYPSGNDRQRRGAKGGDLTPAQGQGGAAADSAAAEKFPPAARRGGRAEVPPQATRLASPLSRAAKRCCQTPPQRAGATSSFLRTSTIRFHAPLTHTSTPSGTHPSESPLPSFTPTPHCSACPLPGVKRALRRGHLALSPHSRYPRLHDPVLCLRQPGAHCRPRASILDSASCPCQHFYRSALALRFR